MKRISLGIAGLALVILSLTGCTGWSDANGRGDAPVGPIDRSGAEVINFPDTYGNVAHKCDGHGHRVYTNTRGDQTGAFVVVISDSTCPGGKTSE